jgi:hypothetical protein
MVGCFQARIQAIIDLLLLYPGIGTRTDDTTIRRRTALPYPYLISMRPLKPRSSFTRFAMPRAILPGCGALPELIFCKSTR